MQSVFDSVLDSIHRGRLLPGARISDADLAAELGVSRTPVREALLRLRQVGLVEASANRYTRVAIVGPRETGHATIVWVALYGALVDEVVPIAPQGIYDAMAADHKQFLEAVEAKNLQGAATTNLSFYSRLMALSENPPLLRGITSVVHIIRLGSFHLPEIVNLTALIGAQSTMLEAVKTHDAALARRALSPVSGLGAPLATMPPTEL